MNIRYKEIVLDGRTSGDNSGHCFRGFGVTLSEESARSLTDYKYEKTEAYREICKLLFMEKYGAAVSYIKIECSMENYSRHTGFMIASDALEINPEITVELSVLSDESFAADCDESYYCIKKILDMAYEKYGLKINCIYAMNAECLRERLSGEKASVYDYSSIKITESDIMAYSGGNVPFNYPEYSVNADGIGISGKGSLIEFSEKVVEILTRGYTLYEYMPEALNGFIVSTGKPWSGHYSIGPGLWGTAHFTHFTDRGWTIKSRSDEKNYTAFLSDEGDYSLVFVNNSDTPRRYSICVRNVEKADEFVHCVETRGPESCDSYSVNWFRVVDKIIPVKKNFGYCYTLEVKPFSVMTCTTLSVDHVNGTDTVKKSEYEDSVLNMPYVDNFDCADRENVPRYASIPCGCFEVMRDGEESFLVQTMTREENGSYPSVVIGDSRWTDYSVKAGIKLGDSKEENYAGIGLRYNKCSQSEESGYQLRIYSDCRWQLRYKDSILEEDYSENIRSNGWNTLKISACGKRIKCYINRMLVCEHVVSVPMLISGNAAIFSGYSRNMFKNLTVNSVIGASPFSVMHDCLCGEFNYSGGWIKNGMAEGFSDRTSVAAAAENGYFEFEFSGEGVALTGSAENLRLKIEIDDKIMAAGLFIGSSSPEEVFYSCGGLENSSHKLKLIVLSGKLEFNNAGTFACSHHILTKNHKAVTVRKTESGKTLKKSTVLIGTGLAAAGAGVLLFRKMFKNRKNKK